MSNPFNTNMDNFNSFLQQAAQAATCGSACQQQQTSEQLQQTYLNAEANLATADNQVQVAQKNYITFTQGVQAYDTLNEQELNQKAISLATEFQNRFNTEIKHATTAVDSYNGLLTNLDNVFELYYKYKNENNELYKTYQNTSSDVLTNERKTYYQDQGVSFLNYIYKYIILTIYVIIVIAYFIFNFIYPTQYNFKYRIIIFIILVILPYISAYILSYLIKLLYTIYNLLPKNVHLSV